MLKSNNYVGVSDISMKNLPKIGYIALLNDQPVAAGFLRRVEGGYSQMDGLTSNPFFGGMIRHDGIRLVVDALIRDAKELKLQGIIAFTKDQGVLTRAKSIGFHSPQEQLIALKLD